MRKKTIAYLFVPGVILLIVGVILGVAAVAGAVTVGANGAAQVGQVNGGMALGSSIAYLVGLILYAISWIGSLVATGKQGRWGWFVCIFLLSPIAELVYLFAGPGVGSTPAAATQG